MELFVEDVDRSVAFYRDAFGFELSRRDPGYASIVNGDVVLGLGPIAKLPEHGGYFTRSRLEGAKGLGVEIVLEVEDVHAAHARVETAGHPVFEPLQTRPWGLTDFRVVDPDGYYLRITSAR
jgi:predicted enzyme related to lactoylglutathione lyase